MKSTRPAAGIEILELPSGKKTIRIQFPFRGVNCRETLKGLDASKKSNIKYAETLRAEILGNIQRNTFKYSDYFPDSKRARLFGHAVNTQTLKEYLDAWLASSQRGYRASTYNAYKRPLESIWKPALGDVRMADLTPEHFRQVLRELNVTLKTARNYMTPLRIAFDQAVDDMLIERNPVDNIKVGRLIDKKKSDYRTDPYTEDEIERLLEGFRQYRPGWLNYFEFQFFTGCRPSETYALRWPNVDLVAGTAYITETVVDRIRTDTTKTEASERSLQLLPRAADALNRQKEMTLLAGAEVFRNPRTYKPIKDYEESARAWIFVHNKTGVRYRNQYQCRHTFASNLLSQGMNPAKVADMLGHADLLMLFKVYGKWIDQGKRKAGDPVTYGHNISQPEANRKTGRK